MEALQNATVLWVSKAGCLAVGGSPAPTERPVVAAGTLASLYPSKCGGLALLRGLWAPGQLAKTRAGAR